MIVVAACDILKGPAYARIIERGVPGACYVEIPGAGHAVVVEKPGEVSDSILRFLAGLGR